MMITYTKKYGTTMLLDLLQLSERRTIIDAAILLNDSVLTELIRFGARQYAGHVGSG
jgi:hypothetical protein